MKQKERKPNGYWTKERCRKEALKYKSKTDFRKKSGGCYSAAQKKGWINNICNHMKEIIKPKRYWTFRRCKEEASKYSTKGEFSKNSSAYSIACANKWINKICSHMEIEGNKYFKFVYVFEFMDGSAYIGLTKNIREREIDHLSKEKSQVYKHLQKTNSTYSIKCLTKNPIENTKAQVLEHRTKLKYINEGWNVLNKGATGKFVGSLGGNILIWTYDACVKEALKYNTKTDFQYNSSGAYAASRKNGWLNEICMSMIDLKKPSGYWTFERCKEEALKYKTRVEFGKFSNSAYRKAIKMNWMDIICIHIEEIRKHNGYWTFETCHKEALKYNTKTDFQYNSSGAYAAANKNEWLDEICYHMVNARILNAGKKRIWTFEKCKEEALKYKRKIDFKNSGNSAYAKACKNGWLDEICNHMERLSKWSYESCKIEASKYNTKEEFSKNSSGAYQYAYKNGWMIDFFSKYKWPYERCKEEASKCKNRSELNKKARSAYKASLRYGWLDDFFPKAMVNT